MSTREETINGLNSAMAHFVVASSLGRETIPTEFGALNYDRRKSGSNWELHLTITVGERVDLSGRAVVLYDTNQKIYGSNVLRRSERNRFVFWTVVKDLPDCDSLIPRIIS